MTHLKELVKEIALEGKKQYGENFKELTMVHDKDSGEWNLLLNVKDDRKYFKLTTENELVDHD
jgi:hypothetical protein